MEVAKQELFHGNQGIQLASFSTWPALHWSHWFSAVRSPCGLHCLPGPCCAGYRSNGKYQNRWHLWMVIPREIWYRYNLILIPYPVLKHYNEPPWDFTVCKPPPFWNSHKIQGVPELEWCKHCRNIGSLSQSLWPEKGAPTSCSCVTGRPSTNTAGKRNTFGISR